MSLPDAPNTLREKYYSVMAGQNDADILPDIETAPSTENRYLDYLARNGGGGGGDVTKAYVDEQDAKKTDKVTSAISGNFAGLDENGNLTDSGKKATDFATASDMTAVQGVIPSTATTQNKLATAADVTGEDITSTSTTSPLTDSADGYVQGVTVKGHSRKTKNLLLFDLDTIKAENTAGTWSNNVYSVSGLEFTINTNGTVKVTGTATGNATLTYAVNLYLPADSYKVNGCPASGSTSKFYIQAFSSEYPSGSGILDIGSGVNITLQGADTITTFRIHIRNEYVCPTEGLLFKPMICTAADYAADPTYEPYFDGIKSIGDAGWGVVDLGTLTWTLYDTTATRSAFYCTISGSTTISGPTIAPNFVSSALNAIAYNSSWTPNTITQGTNGAVIVNVDPSITTAQALATALSGVLLYYPLADTTGATPIFGITSKDGAGQGTAATITTGLPLRSVSDSIYDTLDNEKVVKKCGSVKGSDLTWHLANEGWFYAIMPSNAPTPQQSGFDVICDKYTTYRGYAANMPDKVVTICNTSYSYSKQIDIKDTTYSDATTFAAAIADVEFVYPLATPTETPLSTAEKSALASLRTYDPNTQLDATDEPTMIVDYLLNTNNGKAVARVDRRITVSDTLTLAANAWSNNAQTVTFAHDTAKRNVIDVDPASVEEWANCGVLATAETANNITFSCKSVPTNALSFKVTSMGV